MSSKFASLIPNDSHTLVAENEYNTIQSYDSAGLPIFIKGDTDIVISWSGNGDLVLVPNTVFDVPAVLSFICPDIPIVVDGNYFWYIQHDRDIALPIIVQIMDRYGTVVYPDVKINLNAGNVGVYFASESIPGGQVNSGDFIAYIF